MGDLIGVLGGTFDPPHLAHLILADEARYVLGLKRVLWVVTAQPPHKLNQSISSVDHRVAMVKLVTDIDPAFEFSTADLDRPPPHYAHGTMEWLRMRYPDKKFAYLMGEDSLRDLPAWNMPQRFVDSCDLIGVMDRLAVEYEVDRLEEALPGLKDRLVFLDVPPIMISGREIRSRVRQGRPFRYLMPSAVSDYVFEQGLYS
ncbi:MAG: nicotinate-nucleotide adenylyltransferase [Anaerolineales bacterium]|jgi:nicotinate-nucleotide adenylyltransferase|nr:nicotinate-nucleotide adenylyltransferase [Anaerolineales bacterium]